MRLFLYLTKAYSYTKHNKTETKDRWRNESNKQRDYSPKANVY